MEVQAALALEPLAPEPERAFPSRRRRPGGLGPRLSPRKVSSGTLLALASSWGKGGVPKSNVELPAPRTRRATQPELPPPPRDARGFLLRPHEKGLNEVSGWVGSGGLSKWLVRRQAAQASTSQARYRETGGRLHAVPPPPHPRPSSRG